MYERKTLLIAADLDRSFHEQASRDARFEILDRPVRTEEELAAVVSPCQILVTRSYNRVSRRVIESAPRLELIAQGTSGTDNIDAEAARQRGIAIVSLPGENANAVAELVMGFMIALTRTVPASTRELVAGVWNRYDCATRHELRHHMLGIVGLALDVFDPEPPTAGFADDPRLILTPHIGGCTFESKAAIGAKLFEKIAAFYASR